MKCPRCQHENPAATRFCGQCAEPLAAICAGCGASNSPGNKFCGQCATPLARAALTRFESPEAYTPGHLATKILTSRGALEGERKQVTVLFADLKGSMELLAGRDPEEAQRLLDPVLERMMEAIHRYEGTVNQVMGDGIMALFGAPLSHEDHAVRACYAALRMQDTIKAYADEARKGAGVPVAIRIGLNSGEVVVRSIGSDLHMDYTAVGQTTHLAARMEQAALPGSILMTAATLRLAEGYVEVRPLGAIAVRGLREPVEAYEVTATGSVRTRLQAAAARGLTRFVGREAELELLRRALDRAASGHGQVVAVVGEPGVGKSRLLYECTHAPFTRDWLIVEGRAASYGRATAYLPVIDLLEAYFKIRDGDQPREIREKVTGKLLALDRTLESALSTLLTLLDASVEDPGWQALDPLQRRQRTLDAVKRLLLRESEVQPLLLVFEDLQWIDDGTQALLDGLVESLPTARLLLAVNYRPEYEHAWGGKTYYTQLRIDPLPTASAGALLGALLGDQAGLAPVKRLLLERTEGNPFFIEESVQALVETKILVGERGAYSVARPLDDVRVPAAVQAVLAARIDRLPPEEKSLLQVASVIGEPVPLGLLRTVAEIPEGKLREALARLGAAELLYEASLFPDLEYTFKHALTHEVAYASLLQERRRSLHVRIMEAIERLHGERLAEHVDRLAHHALRGEAWGKAVTYLRRAAMRAALRSAFRDAWACLEQALSALARLPESPETKAQAVDLRLDARIALVPLGEYQRMLDYMREALVLAEELGDRRRRGLVLADLGARLRNLGDHERAIEAGREALAIAEELEDPKLRIEALYRLGQAHFAVGDFARATALFRGAMEDLAGSLATGGAGLPRFFGAWPRAWLALALSSLGQFAEAVAHGEEAVRIAGEADHPHTDIEAGAALGSVHLAQGDLDRGLRVFERVVAVLRARDISDANVLSGLGHACALLGRVDEALPLLEEAVREGTSISAMGVGLAVRVGRLGEACLLAGRVREAVDHGQRALDLSREHGERANEASALRLLGAIASHPDSPDVGKAESHYRQALALADELGMRPLAAHCHFGLGRLYRRTGERQAAHEHLTIAQAMYRELSMRSWLEQAKIEVAGGAS